MPRTVGMYSTNCRVVCYERSAAIIGCVCWCGANSITPTHNRHPTDVCATDTPLHLYTSTWGVLTPSCHQVLVTKYMSRTFGCPERGCVLHGVLWCVSHLVTEYMPHALLVCVASCPTHILRLVHGMHCQVQHKPTIRAPRIRTWYALSGQVICQVPWH